MKYSEWDKWAEKKSIDELTKDLEAIKSLDEVIQKEFSLGPMTALLEGYITRKEWVKNNV